MWEEKEVWLNHPFIMAYNRLRSFVLLLSVIYITLMVLIYKSTRSGPRSLEENQYQGKSLGEQVTSDETTSKEGTNFDENTPLFKLRRGPDLRPVQGTKEPQQLNHSDEDQTPAVVDTLSQPRPLVTQQAIGRVVSTVANEGWPPPNMCLHAFYYMWYANESSDGRYLHWNHQLLPHWDPVVDKRYPHGRHVPPDDVGASFYPQLGCYSSSDPSVTELHLQQMRRAGIGVVAVSWYPPDQSDDNGMSPDPHIPFLLDLALKYSMKVTFHSEPYKTRDPAKFREDLQYIHTHYGNHPAVLKVPSPTNKQARLPLVYVYDSYLNSAEQWSQVFSRSGRLTIRGTGIDSVVVALLVNSDHKQFVVKGGFDGFYTYFASVGFSYGSRIRGWPSLTAFAKQHNLLFIPSAGPGYDDVAVRPWNSANTKLRNGGSYYKTMMSSAVESNTGIVSITSFNEWHEGTQIEAAIPKQTLTRTYKNYLPHSPTYYLDLTAPFSAMLKCAVT